MSAVNRYNFFFWQDEITSSPTSEAPDILSSSSSSCETSQVDDDSAVDIRSRAGSVSSVKVCLNMIWMISSYIYLKE